MSRLLDDLRFARERVMRGWSQQFWARDADGEPTIPCAADAVSFCVCAATPDFIGPYHGAAMAALQEVLGPISLTKWNDAPERTQADVVAAYDAAIRLVEARELGPAPV